LKSYGARMSESMLAILRHILRGEKILAVSWYFTSCFLYIGVLTAVVMKSSIVWDTMKCSLFKVNQHFKKHVISILRSLNKQSSACYLLDAGFLLGLFFYFEVGVHMFLWNIDSLAAEYTMF
jgi:hypothetical protein